MESFLSSHYRIEYPTMTIIARCPKIFARNISTVVDCYMYCRLMPHRLLLLWTTLEVNKMRISQNTWNDGIRGYPE